MKRKNFSVVMVPLSEDFYIPERDVEAVLRRLGELGLTQTALAKFCGVSLHHINRVLLERTYASPKLMNQMLYYVGMQSVPVKSLFADQGRQGHWFIQERCQYCGLNMYDTDEPCQNNPTKEKS